MADTSDRFGGDHAMVIKHILSKIKVKKWNIQANFNLDTLSTEYTQWHV